MAEKKKKIVENNGTYNSFHELLSQEWIDGRYWLSLWYVMGSTLLWFSDVLESRRNILSRRLYWPEPPHPCFKRNKYTQTEEPLNKIHTLESSDMLQNWNFIPRYLVPSALVSYSLRFSQAHWCYSDNTESISSMLRKTAKITPKKKNKKKLIHPLSCSIIEDTIRHSIVQMTSTRKTYIPLKAIIY